MLLRRAMLAALLALAAIASAHATSEHQYGRNEYATIEGGRAPNGKLSLASHGEGEFGNDNFHVWLMAEPGHRKLAPLDDISSDNNLDTAPDAYRAAWSPDSRYVAVTFRSDRHVVTLNLYAVDGDRAREIAAPDLFREVTRAGRKSDVDPRTSVPALTWQGPRRFTLSDYRLFVEDDAALAARLGAFGKQSKMDDGRFTIEFSAEADCELQAGGRIRIGKPAPGTFPESQ